MKLLVGAATRRVLVLILALALATTGSSQANRATYASDYADRAMLVETGWVASHLTDANIRLIDMRDDKAYATGHIAGAVHLAESALRNPEDQSTYLPPPAAIADMMGKAGIGNRTRVIAYDDQGGRMAARLWYVLNAFGHSRVSLLNGGWRKWVAEGRPTTPEVPEIRPAKFTPKVSTALTCPTPEVLARKPGTVVLDARSPEEYRGEKTSPGSTKAGRIPGAVNVDWRENVSGPNQTFKSADELKRLYAEKGITPNTVIISHCASGGRAAHSLFTLKLLGYPHVRIYYGSFSDYTRRPDAPIEKP